jgi:hypothetical protein
MHFYQANFDKIKPGRKYYIFLKKKIVRVEVVSRWEEFNRKIWGQVWGDVGVRVKRLDNGRPLMRLRSTTELYTRNGS